MVSGGGEGCVGGDGAGFVIGGGGGSGAGVVAGDGEAFRPSGGDGAGSDLITVGAQLVSSNITMRQIAE